MSPIRLYLEDGDETSRVEVWSSSLGTLLSVGRRMGA